MKRRVDHILGEASVTKTLVRSGMLVPLICGCGFRIDERSTVPLSLDLHPANCLSLKTYDIESTLLGEFVAYQWPM